MTSRGRGGPRVPDGKPRVAPIAGTGGPNRTDLSALPGTPGTAIPNQLTPVPQQGQIGPMRRALADIPLPSLQPGAPGRLMAPTERLAEPMTAGLPMGEGPGPEALVQTPNMVDNKLAAQEMRYAYPLIMRLASMPNATTQTKILARRFRAALPVQPERVPLTPIEIMDKLRATEAASGNSGPPGERT